MSTTVSTSSAAAYQDRHKPDEDGRTEYERTRGLRAAAVTEQQITSVFYQVFQKLEKPSSTDKKFRILDQGAADLVLLPLYENFAKFLETKGYSLEVVASDPNSDGAIRFLERVQRQGFFGIDAAKDSLKQNSKDGGTEKGYIAGSIQKGNLTLSFAHISETDINDTRNVLGKDGEYDLTLCIYGVLAHIVNEEARIANEKLLDDLTAPHGKIMATLPTIQRFRTEQKEFNSGRELSKKYPGIFQVAPEYTKPGAT